MMFFDFGREEGFPTQFPANYNPVTVDVLEAGLITAFLILFICFLISLPTTRTDTTVYRFIRATVMLLIGLFLLLCNFGQEWEEGHIKSKTPYRAGVAQEINATIGVKIGLRCVNVTLKSDEPRGGQLSKEMINYNERFDWTWDQGRFGFGPFAGHLQQEFRAAQYRGLPIPILWVVDYFVIDGEGFRHGRFYRTAGWYSHIALWWAFACWLLAVILFRSVLRYGAYCLGTSGILQLVANLVWITVRNPLPLIIPFEDETLRTKYGASFWLNFCCGLISLIIAIVVVVMDHKYDVYLYTIFGVDPLNTYDEVAYLTKDEQLQLRHKNNTSNDLPLIEMAPGTSHDEDVEYIPVYKKRHTKLIAPPVIRSNKPHHLLHR